MVRKCFYSFHYVPDNWRVSTIRNIGAIEGNKAAKDNDWETVVGGGDAKIKEWISDQMVGRTCTIILAGKDTADRKWINHEIKESWAKKMGVVVIHIHNIADSASNQSTKGYNPLDYVKHDASGKMLSTIAKAYNPSGATSKDVYKTISDNIEKWIDEAITIRKAND
jgi:hypothetical protein